MKKIVLKISGEFLSKENCIVHPQTINAIAQQLCAIKDQCHLSLVVGGGNIFRGDKEGVDLGITPQRSHEIGMIATHINAQILSNALESYGIETKILPSELSHTVPSDNITSALRHKKTIIFAGGTGNPFFTTDTAAVLRGLQIDADEIWKATNVDGIYDDDPTQNTSASFIRKITYDDLIKKRLRIMDLTAITLAREHTMRIRIFNLAQPDALMKALNEESFGSIIEE